MSILDRATTLLQLFSVEPCPWTISELAEQSHLNPSVCTRILQQLVSLAWVDQAGAAAPIACLRAYSLAGGDHYQQALLQLNAATMRNLAAQFGDAGVVLAVLLENQQQILWGVRRLPPTGIWLRLA